MRWLRHLVVVLVVIVLLVFFVAPYSLGWWAKSQLPKWVSQFNSNNPGVSLTMNNYRRGFFRSTGDLQISVSDLNVQQALGLSERHHVIDVDLAITQGPVVIARLPGKGMSWFWTAALIQSNTDSQAMTLHAVSQLALSNRLISTIDIPHWAVHLNGLDCDIKDAKGDTRLFLTKKKGKSHWDVSEADVTMGNADMQLSLSGLSIDNQFDQPEYVIYGTRHVAVDSLSFQQGTAHWLLKGVSFGSHIMPKAQTTDIDLDAALGSMIDEAGVSGGSLQMTLSIHQVQTSLLNTLYKKIGHLPVEDMASGAVQQQSHALLTPLMNLLGGGLQSQYDMHYQSTFGPVSAVGNINVPPSQGKPMEFIVSSTAQSTVKMPEAWLHQLIVWRRQAFLSPLPEKEADQLASHVINTWKKNKMIIQHDKQLLMELNFQQGQLIVNGKSPDFDVPPASDAPSSDHPAPSGGAHSHSESESQTATSQ